jgi:hypothetical protein
MIHEEDAGKRVCDVMTRPFARFGRGSCWILFSGLFVSACGGGGSRDADPPAGNAIPVAIATSNHPSPYSSLTVTLNGSSSTDPDGTITSYLWTQTAGPTVSLSSTSDAKVTFIVPPVSGATQLSFRLTVTDDAGASAHSDLPITVSAAPISISLAKTGHPFSVDDGLSGFRLSEAKLGTNDVDPDSISWRSSISGALPGNSEELEVALPAGTHEISVRADFGPLGIITRSVTHRVLPRVNPVPASLANAATGASVVIPVVLINYIPTLDGINVDMSVTGPSGTVEWPGGTIDSLQDWIVTLTTRAKFMLEEGSKFRGYKNPEALPYVGYKVVGIYNFYEEMLPGFPDPAIAGNFFPDYHAILSRIPAQELVEGPAGVREIWLNSYHFGKMSLNESNMSSPVTGDVSNSYRTNGDLPVFSSTYLLYQTNFTRSQAEAVHNHGHQIEAMLQHINWLSDGNTDLFWKNFVGLNASGVFEPGRCGATHFPLNARSDYDYLNATDTVQSDCEDWRPDGWNQDDSRTADVVRNPVCLAQHRNGEPEGRVTVVHLLDAEPSRRGQHNSLPGNVDGKLVAIDSRVGRQHAGRQALVQVSRAHCPPGSGPAGATP